MKEIVSGEISQIIPPEKHLEYMPPEVLDGIYRVSFDDFWEYVSGQYVIVIWPDGSPSLSERVVPLRYVEYETLVSDEVWFAEGETVELVVEDTGFDLPYDDSLYTITGTPGDSE